MGTELEIGLRGEFLGTRRFRVDRVLGSGAMGVVYQAFDHDSGVPVALKTLKNWGAQDLYRLKNEFRQLAEVRHENLVQLRELVFEEATWFVSMELVEGTDFLSYVHSFGAPTDPEGDTYDGPPAPLYHPARLKESVRQVATALHELHKRQKVHRDLKPHNVLITPAGRVVVLDFGLVADASDGSASASGIAGTPAYMAPEQVAMTNIGPPADLYALGTMLYEALTGRLPFQGGLHEVLLSKQQRDVAPPSTVHRGVEPEWERLCMALLEREPTARPAASDLLSALGGVHVPAPGESESPFVGRATELEELEKTLAAARAGEPVLVHVEGPSGVGKSTLIKQFLDSVPSDQVVALVARCYERESIPFKAVDGLVDELTRLLVRLGSAADSLLPRDIHALTRVFPVLLRSDAVARAPRVGSAAPDAQELRRRAFSAFKELLGRLADRKRVVLWIDDVQWDDADSAALLANALSPPDPPALLLIATCRSEEAGQSACSKALRKALTPEQVRDIRVDPLTQAQAAELALRLLGNVDAAHQRSEQIARESEGNPLFVGALTQRLRDGAQEVFPSLAELLRSRVQQLPDPARRLLEVLAIEGRPVAQALAFRAAGLGPEAREALATLRAATLARTGGSSDDDSVDVFHGRIRDAVTGTMTAQRARECHRELARALEVHGRVDPERMSLHLFAAGEVERAAPHARSAAEDAARALAFDRAVTFYRQALAGTGDARKWELEAKLADALASAGRSSEAGDHYLAAARSSPPEERTGLLKEATFNLLASGRASEGLVVAREALAGVGMSLPSTPRRALFSMMLRRAWLWLRGLRYRPRLPAAISPLALTRIDLCWSIAMGLLNVDFIRSFDFATRSLLLALEAGDPFRIGRAIAVEANTGAAGGPPSRRRVEKLIAIAEDHAQRLSDPFLTGITATSRGAAHFYRCEWRPSAEAFEVGARKLAEIPGTSYLVSLSDVLGLVARYYAGDVNAVVRGVAAIRVRAQARADPYLLFRMIDVTHLEALLLDRPDRVHSELEETTRSRVEHEGADAPFYFWLLLQARVRLALYEGRGAEAHRLMAAHGPKLEETLLLRPAISVIVYNHLRGMAALAAMQEAACREDEARRVLEGAVGALRRVQMPFARAVASLFGAALWGMGGRSTQSGELLDRAIGGFEQAGMGVFGAAAKRRKGELTGGDEGQTMVQHADAWMGRQSIRAPERVARLCAPCVAREVL